MKYLKLILAGILVVITAAQFFIYGFLGSMVFWLLYSLVYLGVSLWQKFHESSVLSQVLSLVYVAASLVWLIVYAAGGNLSRLTETFYVVLLVALGLALIWEIVSLCLVVREKR